MSVCVCVCVCMCARVCVCVYVFVHSAVTSLLYAFVSSSPLSSSSRICRGLVTVGEVSDFWVALQTRCFFLPMWQ